MTGNISYKDINISYIDEGKGKTIVFLHGFLENKNMWAELLPSFTQKHRVVAIDLLGHGESECLGYVHSMEENAEAVSEVLHKLKVRKAILVGHSMGGYVALAFAELYPTKTKALVLLNSTATEDNEERKTIRDRAIEAVKNGYKNYITPTIANLFNAENRTNLAEAIEKVEKEALKTPLQGIIASLEGMKIRKNRVHILRNDFHTLLVLGEKDSVLNYETAIKQIEGTDVQLVSFPDAHMSHIENTEELIVVLLKFIRSVH